MGKSTKLRNITHVSGESEIEHVNQSFWSLFFKKHHYKHINNAT